MSANRGKISFFFLFIIFSISVIYFGSIYPYLYVERKIPGGALYGLLCTEITDFYQYVSIIRSGLVKGEFLWHNPYAPQSYAPGLVHPTFTVLGHIARILGLDQFEMYFWGRLATCLMFIVSVLGLLFQVVRLYSGRLVGTIFFFTTTPIWKYTVIQSVPTLVDPETYSRSELNSLSRLMVIPPHHYLAISAFIALIINLSSKKIRWWNVLITAAIGLSLPIIHPYVAFYSVGIVIAFFLAQMLLRVHQRRPLLLHILLYCAVSVPMLYVTKLNTQAVFGLTASLVSPGWGPHISIFTYIMVMGWVTIPFLIGIVQFPQWRKNSLLIFVGLWAILPAIWYYTPLGIFSDSPNRLFQIMPPIAMSIIAAYGMTKLTERFRRIGPLILGMVSILCIVYAAPLVIFTFNFFGVQGLPPEYKGAESPSEYSFRLYTIIKPALPILRKEIPDGNVVIAGMYLSNVLSAVTGYHFVNGHIGDTPNFPIQAAEVNEFFYGYDTHEKVMIFLRKYQAAGVIFGVDSIAFDQYPNRDFPYYKKIYDFGGVTIVKVELPKQPLPK